MVVSCGFCRQIFHHVLPYRPVFENPDAAESIAEFTERSVSGPAAGESKWGAFVWTDNFVPQDRVLLRSANHHRARTVDVSVKNPEKSFFIIQANTDPRHRFSPV